MPRQYTAVNNTVDESLGSRKTGTIDGLRIIVDPRHSIDPRHQTRINRQGFKKRSLHELVLHDNKYEKEYEEGDEKEDCSKKKRKRFIAGVRGARPGSCGSCRILSRNSPASGTSIPHTKMKGGWRHDGRHCSAKRERVAWSQVCKSIQKKKV